MSTTNSPSTSAKVLYKPIGLISSIVAGVVASVAFKQIWRRVGPHSDADGAPDDALRSDIPFREILLAALLQGAIFAGVKALVQRQGANVFQKATGEWPGS